MDIHEILSSKITGIPDGLHTAGLNAVKLHVEAAIRHFFRGQREPDETLFTDVIFRCNQAFEGSIKEAYRVLANKDPMQVRPYDIEKFLIGSNLLRPKVLDQLKRYRQEWRNPSAHDYTLDFDEDEALFAIVNVSVFAIVLCDQITTKLAFDQAASEPASPRAVKSAGGSLVDVVAEHILSFVRAYVDTEGDNGTALIRHSRLEGVLGGYLSAAFADNEQVSVETSAQLSTQSGVLSQEADISVTLGDERVVVEIKRATRQNVPNASDAATAQLARYIDLPNVVGGVALIYVDADAESSIEVGPVPLAKNIRVISPKWKKTA